jgi:hypothetical protein
MLTNFLMIRNPLTKHFVGSPNVRPTTWILLASIIAITIASDCITVYYTYWHNRWVNTPLIVIAIVFYFFGGIAFIVSLFQNFNLMNIEMQKAAGKYIDPKTRKQTKKAAKQRKLDRQKFVNVPNDSADEDLDEPMSQAEIEKQVEEGNDQHQQNGEKTGGKNFRKKLLKLQPRAIYIQNENFENIPQNPQN